MPLEIKEKKKEVEKVINLGPKKPTAADLRREQAELLRAQRFRENHIWKSQARLNISATRDFNERYNFGKRKKTSKSINYTSNIQIEEIDKQRAIRSFSHIEIKEFKRLIKTSKIEEKNYLFLKYYLFEKPRKFAENEIILEKVIEDKEFVQEVFSEIESNLKIAIQEESYLETQINRVLLRKVRF